MADRFSGYPGYDSMPGFGGLPPLAKDGLTYVGAGVTGAILARSFGVELLGSLIGGAGAVALAAWWLTKPRKSA